MSAKDNSPNSRDDDGPGKAMIALGVLVVAAALTWAVATLFEISLAKSAAAVILFVVGAFLALLMAGIG
jgi:hypothetical protein